MQLFLITLLIQKIWQLGYFYNSWRFPIQYFIDKSCEARMNWFGLLHEKLVLTEGGWIRISVKMIVRGIKSEGKRVELWIIMAYNCFYRELQLQRCFWKPKEADFSQQVMFLIDYFEFLIIHFLLSHALLSFCMASLS